jgi:tetratricopeptide (TPR) repeat protein
VTKIDSPVRVVRLWALQFWALPIVTRRKRDDQEDIMTKSRTLLFGLMATACVSLSPPAGAEATDQKLGTVHFETSCSPEAAASFDQGMLYQHSFWYRASQREFNKALRADPGCGIAYWGIALSLLWNPHTAPPMKNLADGAAALAKGQEVGAKSERERDYIGALSAMYADYQTVDHRARVLNYMKAMEQLAAKYRSDDEAQILYAISLNVGASPTDKTYANQLKGAALLEEIWQRQPNHPGIPHYLIHLYDTPALAEKGIPAARRYAQVAPDAPHALHMPSHIFTRVGYWQDSIASNVASSHAAQESKEAADQLHAMDYEVYAYLQLGQDARAKAVIDEMMTVPVSGDTFLSAAYALAASPARYLVERGDWKGASALEVRPGPLPYTTAISWFAKGLGGARSGDIAQAQAAITQLVMLRDRLREKHDSYWSGQVDIQSTIVTAWTQLAMGDQEKALQTMSNAADSEDKTEKHPVTPGQLTPARELYGAMLLQLGRPTEALSAFEATMRKEPNRLDATIGAANAAAASGDGAKARQYYAAATAQAADASVDRPEVTKARAFLANAK